MRITLAQLNPIVGDIDGNMRQMLSAITSGREQRADVVVGPEMGILGYPPRDLILREGVVEACEAAVQRIAEAAVGVTVVVGHPCRCADGVRGVRNSASVCRDGEVLAVHDKRLLPGYDIFDEDRYFDAGAASTVVAIEGGTLGILICEDLWRAEDVTADPLYGCDPVEDLAHADCEVVVCLNASPFVMGKPARHRARLGVAAKRVGRPIVCVNQVGGNDDLIFDGRSMIADGEGAIRTQLPGWKTDVRTVATDETGPDMGEGGATLSDLSEALRLGVEDYCLKTGHRSVLIGLSGGIDSAVTAVIAARALGGANVTGVLMPSEYSSAGSLTDARALAENLGIGRVLEIGIEEAHRLMRATVGGALMGGCEGLADENLQARLRGMILMALSNAEGALVLSTSNKSEVAVGYATLYGDMCGALAVLGDVVKTRVYELARWMNANSGEIGCEGPPIPEATITKPPSAELRPDQTDQDSLPTYEVLDAIIERYVDLEQSAGRIVRETGIDAATVESTVRMIDRAEYKRHQSAVILKVTQRAFGRGRPMPIVMKA